jgi:isopenicillin-N N-acyltransferase-like protein
MGRQIGEAARAEIRGFAEIALERVNKTVRVSRERAMSVAARSIPYAAAYAPDMMEEMRGMSEASGCSVEQLMLLQVRNQLKPDADAGCTSLSLAAAAVPACPDRGAIVAQNWDNDPALDPFTIVLTRRPAGKPALMNVTQAGLISTVEDHKGELADYDTSKGTIRFHPDKPLPAALVRKLVKERIAEHEGR